MTLSWPTRLGQINFERRWTRPDGRIYKSKHVFGLRPGACRALSGRTRPPRVSRPIRNYLAAFRRSQRASSRTG
jgi:hypothetical protein